MDANDFKFTCQVTYPPRVYLLIHLYERNQLGNVADEFRHKYINILSDFEEHLESLLETNDTEPRRTSILDTLEGINLLTNYLINLWKIEPNIKRNTSLLSLKMA